MLIKIITLASMLFSGESDKNALSEQQTLDHYENASFECSAKIPQSVAYKPEDLLQIGHYSRNIQIAQRLLLKN